MAQFEDYDKLSYLTKFIFGLHPAVLSEVFEQHPTTLLEAKRIGEGLELTHSMVKMHQTNEKKLMTKNAQHRGTQERRSERLHQSFQLRTQKMKTWRFRNRQMQRKTDLYKFGCISAQKRA